MEKIVCHFFFLEIHNSIIKALKSPAENIPAHLCLTHVFPNLLECRRSSFLSDNGEHILGNAAVVCFGKGLYVSLKMLRSFRSYDTLAQNGVAANAQRSHGAHFWKVPPFGRAQISLGLKLHDSVINFELPFASEK